MSDDLGEARRAVQRAADEADDAVLRRQLESIDEGLAEQTESEKTEADEPAGDQLEELETELARLMDGADGRVLEHVEDARDALDEYRREHTRDW